MRYEMTFDVSEHELARARKAIDARLAEVRQCSPVRIVKDGGAVVLIEVTTGTGQLATVALDPLGYLDRFRDSLPQGEAEPADDDGPDWA